MQGETVLCVASSAWSGKWRSIHQIMSRIARQNRVLFFEPGRDPERSVVGEWLRNFPGHFVFRYRRASDNLIVISTPSSLPYARRHLPRAVLQKTTPGVARVNSRILLRHIRKAVKAFDVKSPILWLEEPRCLDLVGRLHEKLVCYFNYDEYSEFVDNVRIKGLLQQYDNELTKRADLIFATGSAQWERRRQVNPNAHLIPNAADFDHFHRALDPETQVPADVSGLKKPIIGYVGWLSQLIDIDLLLRIAKVHAESSLVLVGPQDIRLRKQLGALRALPNVHFIGNRPLETLPGYLKAFDVALMPYRMEGYILGYPLKLHEYLAAGRAIVSSALPEIRPFGHVLRLAHTPDEFIAHVRAALLDNSPRGIEARVAVARENSWDRRVADIYRIIHTRLPRSPA